MNTFESHWYAETLKILIENVNFLQWGSGEKGD